MTQRHTDLSQLKEAWREASEDDIRSVLNDPEDCSPEVLAIIQQEIERRQIEPASLKGSWRPEPDVVTRSLQQAHSFARAHYLIAAGGVGGALGLCGLCVPWNRIGDLRPIVSCVLAGAFLGGLLFNSWPLRSYGVVVGVTLAAWVCFVLVGMVNMLALFPQLPPYLDLVGGITFHCALFWGAPCLLLSAIVLVRRRYWPVYPSGHCAVCGYNLRGLPEPRCPECGTAFNAETPVGGEQSKADG